MIGIAAPSFDTEGDLIIEELPGRTSLGSINRRVSRRATLDGGAAFEDRGAFDADRTFQIEGQPRRGLDTTLQRLVETYRWLLVSTPEGVFLVAPSKAELSPKKIRLTFLVNEKRST